MKNYSHNFWAILLSVYLFSASINATEINSAISIPQVVSEDFQEINITGAGNISVDTDDYSATPNEAAPISSSGEFANTSITVNTDSETDGIYATGNVAGAISVTGANSNLDNLNIVSGTVTSNVNNGRDGTVSLNGDLYAETLISVGGDVGSKKGSISNTSAGGSAIFANRIADNISLTVNVGATGSVKAFGDSSSSAIKIIDITDNSYQSIVSVINYGLIDAGIGSAISFNGKTWGSLNNYGTVIGNISAGDSVLGINNYAGTITGNINLGNTEESTIYLKSGSITGNITMNNENQNFGFAGGVLNGKINGAGVVTVGENTVANGNIGDITTVTEVSVVKAATFDVATHNNSIVAQNIYVENRASLIVGSGPISALDAITIEGSASFASGSRVTANNLHFTSGSTISLVVSDPSTTSLQVVGALNLDANTRLNLTINSAIGAFSDGQRVTLISASNASNINQILDDNINVNNLGSNSYLGNNISTLVEGNNLLLVSRVQPASGGDSSGSGSGGSSGSGGDSSGSSGSSGSGGDSSGGSGSSGSGSSGSNTGSSGSGPNTQVKPLAETTPNQNEVSPSANAVVFNNRYTSANVISARLEFLRNSPVPKRIRSSSLAMNPFNNNNVFFKSLFAESSASSNGAKSPYPMSMSFSSDDNSYGSQAEHDKSVWVQTFGTNISQRATANIEGYSANSGGIMVGIDCQKCNDGVVVGVSGGYSKSGVKSRDSNKRVNIDSYQGDIYTGYDSKSYFLNTMLGFAVNDYSSNRYIALIDSNAKAKYSGRSYTGRIETGTHYNITEETLLTPTFMITAAHNTISTYSENGAGVLNLRVQNKDTNFLEGRLGAELSHIICTGTGVKMRPQLSISYGYDVIGDKQKSTANFIGQNTTLDSNSARVAQGSLRMGGGFAIYDGEHVTFSTNYGLEKRTDYTAHSLWLMAKHWF